MTFDEAIRKSIKVFLNGKMPMKTGELKEDGLRFTPEYFDDLEAEMLENPIDDKTTKRRPQMNLDAPIPGGNYTADTRNYSWHRPPDLVDYDEAIAYLIDRVDEPEQVEVIFAMLGIDAHITTIVTTILLQAVSKGKVGIDLAVLIAGPLARYIEIKAKDVGLKYEMGIEDKDRVVITPTLLRASLGIVEDEEEEVIDEVNPVEEAPEAPTGGLMAKPDEMSATQDEQAEMLGDVPSEDELPVEEDVVNEL